MIGQTLSHFRILEKIGEGGMGVVYRAEDVELERPVALKVLKPEFVDHERRRERFLREARTAAKVSHPNLAVIHEIGAVGENTFLAMEFIEGATLRQLIGGQPMPVDSALRLALQMAEGLAAAHAAGIVHRDLKPENVMVTNDGRAKILDFGLAKLYEGRDGYDESDDQSDAETVSGILTQEGKILGTVAYMSPEQARGQSVDARSDVFSFGITMYEMLTGRSAFAGETPTDTLVAILREAPTSVVEVNPEVDADVAAFLAQCLEKNVAERPAAGRDLVVELRKLLQISSGSGEYALPSVTTSSTRVATPISSSQLPPAPPAPPSAPSGSGEVAPAPARSNRWQWPLLGVFVIALLVLMARQPLRELGGGSPPPPDPPAAPIANSLAVMTLQNLKDADDSDRLGQILQELIITDLAGQAGGLKVFSSQRLFDLQKQLGGDLLGASRESDAQVARLAGADRMLEGSVSQLGDTWILTTHLIRVTDGTVLHSQKVDGTDLYAMVDDLTELLRRDLAVASIPSGLRSEQTRTAPVAQSSVREKTTSSLEAYRLYLAGTDLLNEGDYVTAADTLGMAIDLDPTFGQAYYKRAMAQWWANPLQDGISGEAVATLQQILDERLYGSRLERLLAEGALRLYERDWNESGEIYQQVVDLSPDEKEAWYGLGEAIYHGEPERRTAAIEAFQEAIRLDPSFSLAYRHIFDAHYDAGQFSQAIALAKRFIEKEPESSLGYRWWVIAASRWGVPEAIDEAMVEARKHHDTPADLARLLVDCANAHRTRDDHVRARPLYEEARRLEAGEFEARTFLGFVNTLASSRDLQAASNLIADVEQLHPDKVEVCQRARISLALLNRDFDEAIGLASSLFAADSSSGQAAMRLAGAFAEAERWDDVEELRDYVVGSDWSSDTKGHFLMSIARDEFTGDRFEQAHATMAQAREIGGEPVALESLFLEALMGLIEEDFEATEAAVTKLEALPTLQTKFFHMLLPMSKGDFAGAEVAARSFLDEGSKHAVGFQLLGIALSRQGRFAEAVEPLRRSYEMMPTYTAAVELAWAMIDGEVDIEGGVEVAKYAQEHPVSWDESVWIGPDSPSAKHCLALAELKRGRVNQAVTMLEEAATLRPDRARIVEDLEQAKGML